MEWWLLCLEGTDLASDRIAGFRQRCGLGYGWQGGELFGVMLGRQRPGFGGQSCLGFRELAWHLMRKGASSRDGWGNFSAPSDLYYQTTRQLSRQTSRQMDCTANTPVCALSLGWSQPPLHSHSQREHGMSLNPSW